MPLSISEVITTNHTKGKPMVAGQAIVTAKSVAPVPAATVDAARRFVEQSQAPNTQRSYATGWRAWSDWAARHGASVLPAEPAAVALWLASLAAAGAKPSTVRSRLAAVAHYCRAGGERLDTKSREIASIMAGIGRASSVAPCRKKAILTDDLRAMVAALDGLTLAGVRDRAVLMLGFGGALRRSEIVALEVSDLTFSERGLEVHIRRSKTDQMGQGATLAIHAGRDPRFCAVAAVQAWIEQAGIDAGPLFRPIVGRKANAAGARALDDQSIALIVQRAAAGAGLDARAYSGHSMRAGFATAAALAGHDLPQIMRQTRHKTTQAASIYVRPADRWRDNPTSDLF
jgi:integrase